MATSRQIAEAFSGHRFVETYDQLAADVRWTLVGAVTLVGRERVIEACEQTLSELADSTTEFLRFVTAAGPDVVAVDAVGRYVSGSDVSVVSSCDIYEFTGGVVSAITSYTVELQDWPQPTELN